MKRTGVKLVGAFFLLAWGFPSSASAQVPIEEAESGDSVGVVLLEPLEVEGRRDDLSGVAVTASQGYVGYRDILPRPLSREGELLETVPGMILTQHSGDGKSNQMFVRGFNLDHGTDFQTRLEGMPLNLPTHGHGQGYTDLNFLIPELVDHVAYRLGTYYPELGDFSAAGGAHFRLRRSFDQPVAQIGVGENGYLRAVAAGSSRVGDGQLLAGGEFRGYDGPWDVPQGLKKFAGVLRYTWGSGANTFSILGLGYDNRWDSSDQIPQRAVDAGVIDRFAQVDSTLGGSSSRFSLSGAWQRAGRRSSQRLNVYGIYYDLDLYSNFTYFLDDPVDGDQINQVDERGVFGLDFVHGMPVDWLDRRHDLSVGLETRLDLVDVALHNTLERERVSTVRADEVTQWGSGAWVSLESRWTSHFRTLLGLRGDFYAYDVSSDDPRNSGDRTAAIGSPKLSLIFGPWGSTEFYGSAGLGFHSNDARGTTQKFDPRTGEPVNPVDPLVRSRGAEIGARSSPLEGWRSTLALWAVELDSELLFVGDAGTTEPSDASRRLGVTWTNYWRITERLTVDLDASFTRARIKDAPSGEDRVPGAIENVVAAGVTWDSPEGGFFGTARVRHFGAYPLIEDNSERASPTTLANLSVGWRFRGTGMRVVASLLNAFDAAGNDIQYWYRSRGQLEPAEGVEDLHFKPIEPRQLRVSLSWGL
ncbi:MAG: TonB-dependent receptor plug domain-containing protein [Gemmatimonadota bacterium]